MNGPRPVRARYIGYTKGTENHGDEALVWIVRELLAPEIDVFCGEGAADIALLGGGTLINQSPWLIDVFADALDRAGNGVVLGAGVGDLAFWGDHFARWAPLLERCAFVGVRGPDSVALLHEHGVHKAECVGDPYLWLRAPVERPPIPQRLGVNLGRTNDSLFGTDDRDLHDYVGEVLCALRERGWTFVWLSVWEKDVPLLDAVRRRVAPDSPLFDARREPLETYAALAGCDVFLGEKLHANAMAAVAGVPFVALEYQPKVRDFACSLDLGQWIVSTAERDVRLLVDRLEALRREREKVRSAMIRARDALRGRLESFAAAIRRHFSAAGQGEGASR